jgi:hypothetical protein
MNVIIQHNEVVHIVLRKPQMLDEPEQEMAIMMLTNMLDVQYDGSELTITRDKYNVIMDISIRFNNIEDAAHFKLAHMWTEIL